MTGEATVAEVLDRARTILERAGIPDPRLEARLLASHALGVSVETVMAYPERRVARKREAELEAVVARRAAREPLAHIVGHREFWSHRFCVTPHTLVPRPDSECMVDAVLRWLGATPSNIRILDLGTGTGCVLLSLLAEVPTAWGVGVDISMAALEDRKSVV